MKAQPLKYQPDGSMVFCSPDEATHIWIITPGPFRNHFIPVQTRGTREGTGNWTWNGDTEKPTLRPSLLVTGMQLREEFFTNEQREAIKRRENVHLTELRCHSWITDGKINFLSDSNHKLAGQTLDLLDVEK
jgi:hypothetical protein